MLSVNYLGTPDLYGKSESILVQREDETYSAALCSMKKYFIGKAREREHEHWPPGQGQHYHLQFCHQRLRKTWAMAKCPVAHGAAEGLRPICWRDHLQLYHQLLVDSLNVSSLPFSLKLNSAKQFRSLSSMHALVTCFLTFLVAMLRCLWERWPLAASFTLIVNASDRASSHCDQF